MFRCLSGVWTNDLIPQFQPGDFDRDVAADRALQTWSDVDAAVHAEKQPFNWLICGCVLFCVIGKFLPVAAMIRADSVGRARGSREWNRIVAGWNGLGCWHKAGSWPILARRALAEAELHGRSPALMMCVWFVPTIIFFAALEFGFTQLECLWSADGDQSSRAHWIRWFTRVRPGALGNVITCLMPVSPIVQCHGCYSSHLAWHVRANKCGFSPRMFGCGWANIRLSGCTFSMESHHSFKRPCGTTGDHVASKWKFLHHAYAASVRGKLGMVWRVHAMNPLFRQLWIGSAIAQGLTAEQLDMVLLHELAHLKRGHCWWRIIPLLVVGVTCMLALTNWSFAGVGWIQLVVSLTMAGGMIWMLGFVSRQCELDADRQASLFAAKHCQWADGQPARAMKNVLAEALVALHDPEKSATQSQWLHPTLAKRIAMKP